MPNKKTIVFKCPKCGETGLIEKVVDVVRWSNCLGFESDEDFQIEYGPTDLVSDFEGGELSGYYCERGHEITRYGNPISDGEDLYEWLEEHGMIEE